MKTRRSTKKTPKITCIEETHRTADCLCFNYPASIIYKHCKDKTENRILGKKGREQKANYRLLSKHSKCEQRWSNKYSSNPNITDGQVELHVLSCRCIKLKPRFKIEIVKCQHKRKKRKVMEEHNNNFSMPVPSPSPLPIAIPTPSPSPPPITKPTQLSPNLETADITYPLNDNCSIFAEEKNQDITCPLNDNSYDCSFDKLSFLANIAIKEKDMCL